jgi:hypothetical protein
MDSVADRLARNIRSRGRCRRRCRYAADDRQQGDVLGGDAEGRSSPGRSPDLHVLGLAPGPGSAWPAHARPRRCRCRCASAPKAPCVAVWLSPHTTVVPGRVKPCSGPTMCTMPCRMIVHRVVGHAEFLGVAVRAPRPGCGSPRSAMPLERSSVVGTLWSGDGEGLVSGAAHRAPGRAQPLEGLRAGHLVDEVAVDIEQAGAVLLASWARWFMPDLVEKGTGLGSGCSHEGGPHSWRSSILSPGILTIRTPAIGRSA